MLYNSTTTSILEQSLLKIANASPVVKKAMKAEKIFVSVSTSVNYTKVIRSIHSLTFLQILVPLVNLFHH